MKKIFAQIISAKDSNTKIAKSLFFGSFLALSAAFLTSQVSYFATQSNKTYEISQSRYDELTSKSKRNFIKKTEYNYVIILIVLVCGTALAYAVIKEPKNTLKQDFHKWN